MNGMRRLLLLCGLVVCFGGCKSQQNSSAAAAGGTATPATIPVSAMPKIEAAPILEHIKVLASDEYEGRSPGTKGEELSVKYIQDQFKQLGLKPGNPDGTYVQKVPLVGITGTQPAPLTVTKGAQKQTFKWADDVVAWTKHVADSGVDRRLRHRLCRLRRRGARIQLERLQGRGRQGQDDHGPRQRSARCRIRRTRRSSTPKTFDGNAMTYYGRWTYKFEEGARKGAAGDLRHPRNRPRRLPLLRRPGQPAARSSISSTPDKNMSARRDRRLDHARRGEEDPGAGRPGLRRAQEAGADARVQAGAARSSRRRWRSTTRCARSIRRTSSRSSKAAIARLKDEYVVYSAHWDHLGVGAPVNGDKIYNGALDNASGVAAVLEIARAFTKVQPPPKRSILFLMVTAEEQGLLGSQYYSLNPLYPLAKTAANINIDGVNQWGRTKDLTVVGLGASDLDDYLRAAAAEQGRTLRAGSRAGKGFLLPVRSLQLRQAGRAGARSRTRASTTSASRPTTARRSATSTPRTTTTRRRTR